MSLVDAQPATQRGVSRCFVINTGNKAAIPVFEHQMPVPRQPVIPVLTFKYRYLMSREATFILPQRNYGGTQGLLSLLRQP
jgi:hypothetical protein